MPPAVPFSPRRVARAAALAMAIALPLVGCRQLSLASPAAAATTATAVAADARRVDALVEAMRPHAVVLLGEVHDNAVLHELRARALRRLVAGGARPALLLEQFDRERQADIDRAAARPGATADEVIAAATAGRPQAMQGWQWEFYRPYIALALAYRLPLVAANVSRDDARRIAAAGLPAAGAADAAVPADIVAAQADAIVAGHCGLIDASQAGGMVAAQVARDRFMARSIESQRGPRRGAAGRQRSCARRHRRAALAHAGDAGAQRLDRAARRRLGCRGGRLRRRRHGAAAAADGSLRRHAASAGAVTKAGGSRRTPWQRRPSFPALFRQRLRKRCGMRPLRRCGRRAALHCGCRPRPLRQDDGPAARRSIHAPASAQAASVQTITAPDGRSNSADSASPSA